MKIAPLNTTDPWFGRITADDSAPKETLRNVPVESTVHMELVELLHGEQGSNFRPYLHLRGELTSVIPSVELPYGVDELLLRRGSGVTIDAFYDFDSQQLGDLVAKGYFTESFRVPDEMSGIPWVLPGSADFVVVGPEFSDQPPVVFMQVHDRAALELDGQSLGDSLSRYFPDYNHEAEVQADVSNPELNQDLQRDGSGFDVFADVEFEEYRPVAEAPQAAEAEQTAYSIVPSAVYSRLLSEIEARLPSAPAIEESDPEDVRIVPGSAADIYRSRVEPGVERVLSGESGPEPDELESFEEGLALLEQEPVEPPASEAEGPSDEERSEAEAELFEEFVEPPAEEQFDEHVEGFLDLAEPEPELTPPPFATQSDADAESKTDDARVRAEARNRARLLAQEEAIEQEESPTPGE